MNLKFYFSIHDIHKNSQRIFSDNYNSKERTRIIVSHADLFDFETQLKIGKIIEKTTKIMDEEHTTLVELFINLNETGKICVNNIFFYSDEQPFHKNFSFEISQFNTFKDTLNINKFYNKNIKINYTNIYDDFKGIFEITEIN